MTTGRFGALCALVAGVLFVLGAGLIDAPGHDDGEQALNDFYGDSGNRLRIILGAYSWALSGMALLGLGAVLSSRAERAGAPLVTTRLMLLACCVASVLLMAAGAAQVPTYALSIDAFDEPESVLTRATIPHMGYSFLLFSMLAAAAFIAAVGAAVRATAMLPGWVSWASFVAAGLLIFSVIFMPMIAFPIWLLAIAVALWRANPLVTERSALSP